MSYPQPRTNDQVAAQNKQIRFTTKAVTPGDIYEFDSACVAFALGPESDFAQMLISYYDKSAKPSLLSTSRITPYAPLVAQVEPRLDTTYPLASTRVGRTLISIQDIYGQRYMPSTFNVANDQGINEPVTIDILGWLSPPATLPFKRADKVFRYLSTPKPPAAAGHTYRVIPTYGRKYIFIDFFNNSGATVNMVVLGVNFTQVANPNPLAVGPRDDQETTLFAAAPVNNGARQPVVVKASNQGMFDSIVIGLGNNAGPNVDIINAPLRVYVSDDPL